MVEKKVNEMQDFLATDEGARYFVEGAATLGELCRRLRVARNMTQTEVASRSKVPSQRISEIERDLRKPSENDVIGLAKAFEVRETWLLYRLFCEKAPEQLRHLFPEVRSENEIPDWFYQLEARIRALQVLPKNEAKKRIETIRKYIKLLLDETEQVQGRMGREESDYFNTGASRVDQKT